MPATASITVTMRPIRSIRPYEKNPRVIPAEAIDAVARSIATFGFQQPIVVDKAGVIIVGHTRYRAALKLAMKEVPVHVAENLTAAQVQAYRIADNSTNTLTSWDLEMLQLELADMPAFDFTDFGLDLEAVEAPTMTTNDDFDVDEAVAKVKVPRSKPGDVWVCGAHRVMCGDATKDLARLMDGGRADCVWTDPPYNVSYTGGTKEKLTIENDTMDAQQFSEFLLTVFTDALTHAKPGGVIYVTSPPGPNHENFQAALRLSGWQHKQNLIWVKDAFVLGRSDYHYGHEPILYGWKPGAAHGWFSDRRQTSVLRFDRPRASEAHPTMKPVALVGYCIANSTRKGNCVLDPFGGAGSTMIAAEQLARAARLMEIDPIYCDVIVGRWEQFTGATAERNRP